MIHNILLLMTAFMIIDLVSVPSLSAAAIAPSTPSRLVGTVEGAPFTGAVFDDGTGVQTFYRLHEQLPDGSYIVKVRNDSILIKKTDGVLYEIYTTGTANSAATTVPSTSVAPAGPRGASPNAGTVPLRPRGRAGRSKVPEADQ
jgi:hypothetical protein